MPRPRSREGVGHRCSHHRRSPSTQGHLQSRYRSSSILGMGIRWSGTEHLEWESPPAIDLWVRRRWMTPPKCIPHPPSMMAHRSMLQHPQRSGPSRQGGGPHRAHRGEPETDTRGECTRYKTPFLCPIIIAGTRVAEGSTTASETSRGQHPACAVYRRAHC